MAAFSFVRSGLCRNAYWLLPALFAAVIAAMSDSPARATDIQPLPPAVEAATSPSGSHTLIISMNGEERAWIRTGSTAELRRNGEGNAKILWRLKLPHNYRPRTAIVTDRGDVVLFDQWINVLGPFAVMIIGPEGGTRASHDFRAVVEALDVPASRIASLAKAGPWRQGEPKLDAASETVRVKAGGKTLVVSVRDGSLRAAP